MKKRWLLVLLVLSLGMAFSGCREEEKQAEVKPAILTEREEKLVEIFQSGANGKLFDYQVNQSTRNIKVSIWKLNEEGEWEDVGFLSQPLEEIEGDFAGRIAVLPNNDHTKVELVLQDDTGTSTYESNLSEESKMTSWASTWMEEGQPLENGKELPLCILYGTTKKGIDTFQTTAFFEPKQLMGTEEVYGITILMDGETGIEKQEIE